MNIQNDRYAVFGNPITHSLSPLIHQAFAKQTGQDLSYQRIEVPLDRFKSDANAFFGEGGKGLNVTLPFKQEACSYADEISERAQLGGAVNTLIKKQDGIFGDNTDGAGLLFDIQQRLAWPISNKRVLLLGAGGAVRGVVKPLLDARPSELIIANRTHKKALELVDIFAPYGKLHASTFEDLNDSFDLVINGTAASLSGEMPTLPEDLFSEQAYAYDMAYGKAPTVFLRWAQARGAIASEDGLGMLVAQAAESFWLWRQVRPEVGAVLKQLRQRLL